MAVAKKRILLVEDERELREVLALGLRRAGYSVELAETATDAYRMLEQKRYALVITDWRLPDGNGIDLADKAAKLRAKTIIMSGYLFTLPASAADRHGLLTKPISIFNLVAAVQHRIGNPSA